jgi:hypothetical protein
LRSAIMFQEGVTFEKVASDPEAFITYKLGYRCKHCGKEWSRLSVKAVGLPENYVEDEEEKTEYDASKEEEEAREDEYVEEQE